MNVPSGAHSVFWSRRYAGSGGATNETAVDLEILHTIDSNGIAGTGVFIAGNRAETASGPSDFLTLGYPNIQNPLQPDPWHVVYDNGSDDQATNIALGFQNGFATHRVYVGGSSVGSSGTYDMTVVAYDMDTGFVSDGWDQPFRTNLAADDRMADMIIVPEHHLYIAGRWYNGTDYDYRIEKINLLEPTKAWTNPAIYNIGAYGSDFPAALTFRQNVNPPLPNGEARFADIYVTGRNTAFFESAPRYATVKFSQVP